MEGDSGTKDKIFVKNKFIIIFVGVFVVLVILIIAIFFAMKMVNDKKAQDMNETIASTTKQTDEIDPNTGLPLGKEIEDIDKKGNGLIDEAQIASMSFGDFYEMKEDDFVFSAKEYELPLNVKVDVANYHDVSRKVNLDQGIDSLNNNGFAVVGNPFSENEADNFYNTYSLLDDKQVPLLITKDFLIYYYQNMLKLSFKDIEASVFYENLWETNKKLYSIAKGRYEEKLEEKGVVNDIYLEGARKELAFFAVALNLLSPVPEQIEKESGFSTKGGFSLSEANQFSFQLPNYLKNDVILEVELIKEASQKRKSPVLLFERNYEDFLVPERYQENARLNNFYLAASWLNSVFPLHYKSESCEECLLDKNDWQVSMCSALLLAEDFSDNQDLQNKWAKIYKIMSFFSGLRGDLNYLYYKTAFDEMFGEEKRVEDIFSEDQIDENLLNLSEKISQIDFLEIEGSLNKEGTTTRPFLGMKMLVEDYWPNDYIFKELTYPKTGLFKGSDKEINRKINNTYCFVKRDIFRCFGFGFDIISLIYDIGEETSVYIDENTKYEDYDVRLGNLKKQIDNFSNYTWHSNNFWTTLDIASKFLHADDKNKYVFMKNEAYKKRDLNAALSSWVNLQLPADIFDPYKEDSVARLNDDGQDNQFIDIAYIEPDLVLVKELLANTNMIVEMLSLLKVDEHENTVLIDLNNLKNNLEKVEAIIKKELSGKYLTNEDYEFMNEFIKEFEVKDKGKKSLIFSSPYENGKMTENIDGVKLLVLTYQKDDKNFFVVGPVFNYWESRK